MAFSLRKQKSQLNNNWEKPQAPSYTESWWVWSLSSLLSQLRWVSWLGYSVFQWLCKTFSNIRTSTVHPSCVNASSCFWYNSRGYLFLQPLVCGQTRLQLTNRPKTHREGKQGREGVEKTNVQVQYTCLVWWHTTTYAINWKTFFKKKTKITNDHLM